MMKKFLKYALCILVSNLFAISDKVAIVINNEVITEMVLDHYVENFAKVSGNMEQIHDSGFRNYATKMMVTSHLIASFARANEITLTPEEEVRALTQLMEAQGKRIEDFDAVAKEHGIDATWMREFILSNVLQQKVGMLAVAP